MPARAVAHTDLVTNYELSSDIRQRLLRDDSSQPNVATASVLPFTLAALIAARQPNCPPSTWAWLRHVPRPRVAYVAVARTGSESLEKALSEHHSKKALEQNFTAHAPHSHH